MQAERFIPTPLLSLILEYQMEYIKDALSAQSEEITGLAGVQQKMELHEAAVNALVPKEEAWGRYLSGTGLLPGTCFITLFFILSRTPRVGFTFCTACFTYQLALFNQPWCPNPIKLCLFYSARIKILKLIFKAVPYKICNMFYKMTQHTSIFQAHTCWLFMYYWFLQVMTKFGVICYNSSHIYLTLVNLTATPWV